jgi:hypothetical protein
LKNLERGAWMRKALIVGINNYDNANNLRGCENDANAVKGILETHSDDRLNFTIINPNFDVGTKVGLLDEVKELFNGNIETDIALFYFSGHGGYDSSSKEGYIITTNFNPAVGNVIYMNEILNAVNSSKIRNKIVILDCCHAGAMGNITESTAALKEGVTILSASKSNEVSLEISGHGVFTSLLLEALRGGAADLTGHVTAGGIYAYIDKALGPCGQRPVFKTNTAQFLPLREAEPPVGRKILRKISSYFPNPTDDYKLNPSFEFTNIKDGAHRNQEPYALPANVAIFEDLKALNKVGLVIPNCDDLLPEERYMYFAAMESKSCKLTPIGRFYWKLAKDNKI